MDNIKEIRAVVDKFYEVISGKADEERDWTEFKSLFFSSDSSLASMKYAEGVCITKRQDVNSYIEGLSNFLRSRDFYEYGFNYEVKIFQSIANVYSQYAAKRKKEESEIIKSGVSLVQLIHDGREWKIHSMLWQDKVE